MKNTKQTKILITGASGFIGKNLSHGLRASGYSVLGIDSAASESKYVPVIRQDILDAGGLSRLLKNYDPDWVIHLAENRVFIQTDNNNLFLLRNNISSLINIFSSLPRRDVRFIYFSSGEVYGKTRVPYREVSVTRPASGYGLSKLLCELVCAYHNRLSGRPLTIVRPAVVYGPGQQSEMLIPSVIKKVLLKKKVSLTEGKQTRDFIYIQDIVFAILRIFEKDLPGFNIFNLGSGCEISVKDMTKKILGLMGNPVRPNFGALPYRSSEVGRYYLDIARAKKVLGWRPRTSSEEGLCQTIAWWREALKK